MNNSDFMQFSRSRIEDKKKCKRVLGITKMPPEISGGIRCVLLFILRKPALRNLYLKNQMRDTRNNWKRNERAQNKYDE